MLLGKQSTNRIVESNSIKTVDDFSVKLDGMAYEILSSQLYSNKQAAVVREYICNAMDGHRKAGIPFDTITVHAPTRFEEWFEVRDYGIGMDDEFVRRLFTTFFHSDKRTDADAIGGLGLGSKSAFGICKSFTVTTWSGSSRSVYACFIDDETGKRKIARLDTSPSDEPRGVSVRIPIAASMTEQVSKETCVFLGVLKNLAGIEVKSNVTPTDFDVLLDDPAYAIVGKSFRNHMPSHSSLCVLQGGVLYPVNFSDSSDAISRDLISIFNNTHVLVLKADTSSDVSVAPSREALSYDPRTKGWIAKKYYEFRKKVEERIKADFYEQGITPKQVANRIQKWTPLLVLPRLLGSDKVLLSNGCSFILPASFNAGHLQATVDPAAATSRNGTPGYDVTAISCLSYKFRKDKLSAYVDVFPAINSIYVRKDIVVVVLPETLQISKKSKKRAWRNIELKAIYDATIRVSAVKDRPFTTIYLVPDPEKFKREYEAYYGVYSDVTYVGYDEIRTKILDPLYSKAGSPSPSVRKAKNAAKETFESVCFDSQNRHTTLSIDPSKRPSVPFDYCYASSDEGILWNRQLILGKDVTFSSVNLDIPGYNAYCRQRGVSGFDFSPILRKVLGVSECHYVSPRDKHLVARIPGARNLYLALYERLSNDPHWIRILNYPRNTLFKAIALAKRVPDRDEFDRILADLEPHDLVLVYRSYQDVPLQSKYDLRKEGESAIESYLKRMNPLNYLTMGTPKDIVDKFVKSICRA